LRGEKKKKKKLSRQLRYEGVHSDLEIPKSTVLDLRDSVNWSRKSHHGGGAAIEACADAGTAAKYGC